MQAFSQSTHDIEIVLVNDGSTDNTWSLISSLGHDYPQLLGVNLSRNFGQQSAVLCGFAQASGEYIVTMDDDLQHAPEDILTLYEHLLTEDLDLVIACLEGKQHGFLRKLGTRFVQSLSSHILGTPGDFRFSSFRVMKKFVAKRALELNAVNPVVGFLLIQTTNKIANYPVSHAPRKHGKSNYSLFKLINYCLVMLLDYSSLPLRVIVYMGSLIALLSFILSCFYLTRWWLDAIHVSGFTTLVLLICFFFGLLFISIGVIGSYLIRILQSSRAQPLYLIRETTKTSQHNEQT